MLYIDSNPYESIWTAASTHLAEFIVLFSDPDGMRQVHAIQTLLHLAAEPEIAVLHNNTQRQSATTTTTVSYVRMAIIIVVVVRCLPACMPVCLLTVDYHWVFHKSQRSLLNDLNCIDRLSVVCCWVPPLLACFSHVCRVLKPAASWQQSACHLPTTMAFWCLFSGETSRARHNGLLTILFTIAIFRRPLSTVPNLYWWRQKWCLL